MAHAVRFEEVTKRYPRGWTEGEEPRYASLRHDLVSVGKRLSSRARGRPARETGALALKDVSFEIEEGESFAVIGPNGAGKSTALKLISRISYPTSGRLRIRGRVAALMEVGSGVHPELTGRENIWLYGQILGMNKADIRRRFDEIVAFSELGGAIDTPVKFFSSGMQLRLGFSIAAHLEPDIFVVDEALAVGDAGFQAKCVERMTKLVAEGHTLVFVSHDLSAIEAVCGRGIFLRAGAIVSEGSVTSVLLDYIDWIDRRGDRERGFAPVSGGDLTIRHVTVHDESGAERYAFATGESVEVRFHIHVAAPIRSPFFSLGISGGGPGTLVLCSMLDGPERFDLDPGSHVVVCRMQALPLGPRSYELWTSVRGSAGIGDILDWTHVGDIRFAPPRESVGPGGATLARLYSPVVVEDSWSLTS